MRTESSSTALWRDVSVNPVWLQVLRTDSLHFGGDYLRDGKVVIAETPFGALAATPAGQEAVAAGASFVTVKYSQRELEATLAALPLSALTAVRLRLSAARVLLQENLVEVDVLDASDPTASLSPYRLEQATSLLNPGRSDAIRVQASVYGEVVPR